MSLPVPDKHAEIDWPIELEQHREWMRSIAISRLGNAHAAEDVVQEASLAVIRQNGRPTDPTKVRAWLYQVVVRRCADLMRHEYGEVRRAAEWAERAGIDEASERDWLLATERQQLVREALSQLSDEDRQLIELKYAAGQSYRQLAVEFGVTERVVEYRLLKAKQQLREELRVLSEDE